MDFKLLNEFPDNLEHEWNLLLDKSVTHVPFLRYEYQKTWWETRGGGEWKDIELKLVTAHDQGELCGIAPFFESVDSDGNSSMKLVGSFEVSDYLDVIVQPSLHEAFVGQLLPYLGGPELPNWKTLDFYNILDGSPTLDILESCASKLGWEFVREKLQHSPYIPLRGDWEAYLAGIDKKQRHEVRRKVRRLEESGTASRWYFVEDRASLDQEMDDFIKMMAQDPDKQDFLTPEMIDHMHLTARCAFDQGCLSLAFLEIDGEKAAGKFCFDYLNRVWAYNSGVNRKFNEFSPGWILLAYLLRWANEKNYTEMDMMRGNEEYKYRFGGIDRFVMRGTVTR